MYCMNTSKFPLLSSFFLSLFHSHTSLSYDDVLRTPRADPPVKLGLKRFKYIGHDFLLIAKIETKYQQSYLGDA